MAIVETPVIQDRADHVALVQFASQVALSQERQAIQMIGWLQGERSAAAEPRHGGKQHRSGDQHPAGDQHRAGADRVVRR